MSAIPSDTLTTVYIYGPDFDAKRISTFVSVAKLFKFFEDPLLKTTAETKIPAIAYSGDCESPQTSTATILDLHCCLQRRWYSLCSLQR